MDFLTHFVNGENSKRYHELSEAADKSVAMDEMHKYFETNYLQEFNLLVANTDFIDQIKMPMDMKVMKNLSAYLYWAMKNNIPLKV